ncbi:hypothetical protein MRX96_055217, partial [Rhipicephalus microplus]
TLDIQRQQQAEMLERGCSCSIRGSRTPPHMAAATWAWWVAHTC